MQIYQEIVNFLASPVPEVRLQAVQCVLSLSTTDEAINFFAQSKCVLSLKNLCFDSDQIQLCHDALKALINLSGNARISTDILATSQNDRFLDRLCLSLVNPKYLLSDLCCMLLSNLTKFMAASMDKHQSIVSQWIDNRLIDRMMEAFSRGRAYNAKAEFHFLATVFSNLSASDAFRRYLMDAERDFPVRSLKIFTEHPNVIRRGGAISTLKTLCLLSASTDNHLLLVGEGEDKVDLLPCLLLPLAGPEELSEEDMDGMPDELQLLPADKVREQDHYLRQQLVDTLLTLTTSRPARELMRQRKVYPIIREAHLNETDPGCEQTMQELVQMLMRDEEGNASATSMTVQDSAVEMVEESRIIEVEEEIEALL